MKKKTIKVAMVGLGFGAEFIPIYQAHPNAELGAICQRTKSKLDEIGDAFGISKRYTSTGAGTTINDCGANVNDTELIETVTTLVIVAVCGESVSDKEVIVTVIAPGTTVKD